MSVTTVEQKVYECDRCGLKADLREQMPERWNCIVAVFGDTVEYHLCGVCSMHVVNRYIKKQVPGGV